MYSIYSFFCTNGSGILCHNLRFGYSCVYIYIINYNSHIFAGRPRTGALIGPLVFFLFFVCVCVGVCLCLFVLCVGGIGHDLYIYICNIYIRTNIFV